MEYITLPHYCSDVEGVTPFIDFGNPDDAGMDLRSSAPTDITLQSGEDYIFPTGLQIHIGSTTTNMPIGMGIVGMIVPRSGLGFKHYTRLANTAGIIDSGYQKEIMVKIRNESDHEITISRGERMCQMMFMPYFNAIKFDKVQMFTGDSERGAGFGSSGRI